MLQNLLCEFRDAAASAAEILSENFAGLCAGLVVFILFALLRKKLSCALCSLLERLFAKKPEIAEGIRLSVIKPLSVFLLLAGLWVACLIAGLPAFALSALRKLLRIAIIALICWALMNFMPYMTAIAVHFGNKGGGKANEAALKLTANLLRILLLAITIVIIISELGYNINGLIAGLGLGGLGLSFAGKNTLSNFFGGFSIVSDGLFDVGDYIVTGSAEGVVEDITMRSTKVRTLEDTVTVIPNASLAEEAVTNKTRMNKRYAQLLINLTYDSSEETLRKCASDIEQMLREQEEVDDECISVTFDGFSSSSLDLRIIYFTRAKELYEYYRVTESVNYKIMEIIKKNGAEFAFPSTTVYKAKGFDN